MRLPEIGCFLGVLGVEPTQLKAVNLPYEALGPSLFASTDVFLVGGAGDYSVLNDYSFLDPFFHLLCEICEKSHPLFASCFGFQALCRALGGKVIHDPQNAEVGTYKLNATAPGRTDPLFQLLPNPFNAQMGHKDRAAKLPEEAVNLAFSERCPFQAFKLPGKPIYATQFHPELTMEQNRQRFENYLRGYSDERVGIELEFIRNSFRPSEETSAILPEFITKIVQA